jgi:hypothetical protein
MEHTPPGIRAPVAAPAAIHTDVGIVQHLGDNLVELVRGQAALGQIVFGAGLDRTYGDIGVGDGENRRVIEIRGASVTVSALGPIGDFENPPTDPDGDGLYEDINGNSKSNIVDVQAFFANRNDPVIRNNPEKFDFSGNGRVNVVDVQNLFNEVLN